VSGATGATGMTCIGSYCYAATGTVFGNTPGTITGNGYLNGVVAISGSTSLTTDTVFGIVSNQTPNNLLKVAADGATTINGSTGQTLSVYNTNTAYGYAIFGQNAAMNYPAIYGKNIDNAGTATGVLGEVINSTSGIGVQGTNSKAAATGYGVYGWMLGAGNTGQAVRGQNDSATGINYGVYGIAASTAGYGGYFSNTAVSGSTYGVYGTVASPSGYALWAQNTGANGYSAYFKGKGFFTVNATDTSGTAFTHDYIGADAWSTGWSEISNDIGTYKALMLIGNYSRGLGNRQIQMYDRVGVGGIPDNNAPFSVVSAVGATTAIFGATAPVAFSSYWPGVYFNGYFNAGAKVHTAGYGGILNYNHGTGQMIWSLGQSSVAAGVAMANTDVMTLSRLGELAVASQAGAGNTLTLSGSNAYGLYINSSHSSAGVYSYPAAGATYSIYAALGGAGTVIYASNSGGGLSGSFSSAAEVTLDIYNRARFRSSAYGSAGMWYTTSGGTNMMFTGMQTENTGVTQSWGVWSSAAGRFVFTIAGNLVTSGLTIYPGAHHTYSLGASTMAWAYVYSWAHYEGGGGWQSYSDIRKKNEISNADRGLEFIEKLRPVRYKYREDKDGRFHYGFIAQDVLSLDGTQDWAIVSKEPDSDYLTMAYMELISPMVKAIQELSAKVTDLAKSLVGMDEKVQKLEQKLEQQQQLIEQLTGQLCTSSKKAKNSDLCRAPASTK